jgi:hypothetical protein
LKLKTRESDLRAFRQKAGGVYPSLLRKVHTKMPILLLRSENRANAVVRSRRLPTLEKDAGRGKR